MEWWQVLLASLVGSGVLTAIINAASKKRSLSADVDLTLAGTETEKFRAKGEEIDLLSKLLQEQKASVAEYAELSRRVVELEAKLVDMPRMEREIRNLQKRVAELEGLLNKERGHLVEAEGEIKRLRKRLRTVEATGAG